MGQYHLLVNLDKNEYICPHTLGTGLKLWEQVNTHPGPGAALIVLLAASNGRGGGDFPEGGIYEGIVGRWAGDRIAIVGDYAEIDDLPAKFHADTIYHRCNEEYTGKGKFEDISEMVAPVLEELCGGHWEGDGRRNWISDDDD